jgi:hypothetical protein
MKRFDPRLWLGILLVLGGVLSLLGSLNIISDAGDIFWGMIFAAAGLFFLYMLYRDRNSWWAAFPGFTLLGLALSNFLPNSLEAFDGLVFFAGISAAFWWVYFNDRRNWWAIIPGGVLLTLGLTSAVDDLAGIDTGGFFFLGLGLTFILVGILPGESGRSWAFIPGVILLIFGAIIGTPAVGLLEYIWPGVLILLGLYFVFRFFRSQSQP